MLIKNILKRGIKGAVIGVFIIQTIGVIMMLLSRETNPFGKEFLISQYVAGAIIGFVFGGLNILFQLERIGIIGATLIHFTFVLTTYIPCANMAGWFRNDIKVITSTMLIFVLVYFIIWLICYLQWKKEINEINTKLNLRRGE
jgi:uncharacterized membrane protein